MDISLGIYLDWKGSLANHKYTTVVSDDFNRADQTGLGTAVTGQTWSDITNGHNIVSNQASPRQGGATNLTVIDATASDIRLQAKFATYGSANPAMVYRYVDSTHYGKIQAVLSTGTISVVEIGGGGTLLSVSNLTLSNGDVVAADFVGSTIVVYLNGIPIGVTTTTLNLTATKHGLLGGASTTTKFDDFLIQSIV